jgi:hypothetical protein
MPSEMSMSAVAFALSILIVVVALFPISRFKYNPPWVRVFGRFGIGCLGIWYRGLRPGGTKFSRARSSRRCTRILHLGEEGAIMNWAPPNNAFERPVTQSIPARGERGGRPLNASVR